MKNKCKDQLQFKFPQHTVLCERLMKAGRMANGFLFCDHRPHLHKHTKRTVFPIAAWDRHLRLHSIPSFGYEQRVPLGGGISHFKCLHSTRRQGMGISAAQACAL